MYRSKLVVVVMSFALLATIGCSKRNKEDYKKVEAPKTNGPKTIVGTKELVRNFAVGPTLKSELESQYGVDSSTTCVQWVKVTSGSSVKQIALIADVPCPASGVLSDDQALPLSLSIELNSKGDEGNIVDSIKGARIATFFAASPSWVLLDFCTGDLQAITSSPLDTASGPYYGCELVATDHNLMNINYFYPY